MSVTGVPLHSSKAVYACIWECDVGLLKGVAKQGEEKSETRQPCHGRDCRVNCKE